MDHSPQKTAQAPLRDPRALLQRCHERLHRRGATEDVPLAMVRLLLAKWHDEQRPDAETLFYCTPAEYQSAAGRRQAAARAEALFREVRDAYSEIFEPHERLGASTDEIVEVMTELQAFRLQGDDDLLGAAYEEYTARALKREGGEFFTNRLIVKLLTDMVEPDSRTTMLDPAGGAGGFAAVVLRRGRGRVFLIDKKPRLVKFARAALLLAGNDHPDCIQGDGLAAPQGLPACFLKKCRPGKLSLVMTNPPWSGLTHGRITDPLLLQDFAVAHRWSAHKGRYRPTTELLGGGIPPEYLFVERCIRWLAPGGTLAIVLPKGILDNLEPALGVRHYLLRHCRVLAVINCHKNAFQPYTGSRGCLIVARKKKRPSDERDYPIFMAINRKIGQDSEGEPLYKKDEYGRPTTAVDEDLGALLTAWKQHLCGELRPSEYTFAIDASQLDGDTLKLNPQFFLPSLNESLRRIVALDGNGFAVERLGDRIATRIWKGARFKREDLEVEAAGAQTVAYHTPSSIFMRGEGLKLLDLAFCTAPRRKVILEHRARAGEILLTRSGTVGRVALVGRTLSGVLLSDDLIRIWIEDPRERAFVYAFLRSRAGQDQLRRNEYGTVQQHLEPAHVADVLLPLPEDGRILDGLLEAVLGGCEARERAVELEERADKALREILKW
jgi:type I restriction enzyme M protein